MIADLSVPLLGLAFWLAAAVAVRETSRRAYAWAVASVRRHTRTAYGKAYAGRHTSPWQEPTPMNRALWAIEVEWNSLRRKLRNLSVPLHSWTNRASAVVGATADWSPSEQVGAAGISEELMTPQMLAEAVHEEVTAAVVPRIEVPLAHIDEELAGLMKGHGARPAIRPDDLDAYEIDQAGERIAGAVRSRRAVRAVTDVRADFAELRRRFAAAELPTGAYAIILPRSKPYAPKPSTKSSRPRGGRKAVKS